MLATPAPDQQDGGSQGSSWRLSFAGLYATASILSSVVGLIVVAVLARLLGPTPFGLGETAAALLLFGGAVGLVGLDAAVAIVIHGERHPSQARYREIVSTALCIAAGGSVAIAIVALLGQRPGTALLLAGRSDTLLALVGVATPAVVAQGLALALLRNLGRARAYLAASAIGGTVQVVAAVTAVASGLGAASAVIGIGAGALATFTVAFVSMRELLAAGSVTGSMAARLLRLGLPLVPAAVGLWAIAAADRVLVLAIAGAAEVGLYAAATKVAAGAALLVSAFSLGWIPYALRIQHRPSAPSTYRDALAAYAVVSSFVIMLSALLGRVAVTVLAGDDYSAAGSVVWMLVTAAMLYGAYLLTSIGVQAAGRTGVIGVAALVAAVVNVLLNLLLIPRAGYAGAAAATLAANALLAALVLWAAQRTWPMPYATRRLAAVAAATVVTAALIAWVPLMAVQVALVAGGCAVTLGITGRTQLRSIRAQVDAMRRGD